MSTNKKTTLQVDKEFMTEVRLEAVKLNVPYAVYIEKLVRGVWRLNDEKKINIEELITGNNEENLDLFENKEK